jgi:hypothetical protein
MDEHIKSPNALLDKDLYRAYIYLPDDFPIIEIQEDLIVNDLPEFMRRIADDSIPSQKGLRDFFERFGMHYLTYDFVRKHTQGWCFLFVAGEYRGAFEKLSDAVSYGEKFNGVIMTYDMFLMTIYE